MFVIILLILIYQGECKAFDGWNWTHPVQKTVIGEDGIYVTVDYMKFKRLKEGYNAVGHFSAKQNLTQLACGNECTECQRCVTFGYNYMTGGRCWLYEFRLLANPDEVTFGETTETRFFEIESPCTIKPSICEHGSTCSINRLLGTYECINCLPPYSGKYCNETSDPVSYSTWHEDILYGRNSSCSALKMNYGIGTGIYWIHPWRDERKIKVTCGADGTTEMSYLDKFDETPPQILTSNHLMDGLEMDSGNRLVDASFLNTLHKLIQFDYIYLTCESASEAFYSANNLEGIEEGAAMRKYLSNESETRPSCHCSSGTVECSTVENQSFSSNNVTNANERPYKDVLVLENGKKFSMSDEDCFEGKGNYNYFFLDIW